ncbi:ribosomal protein L4 domain-containing protein [Phellopilus nigrolimitatus]|nr:ribosomal protein L4 domain-containing protein [Phellopilus nigrolimitatus]
MSLVDDNNDVHDLNSTARPSESIAKNKRQPYAVSKKAVHQTSAESWGTGRTVARIPRAAFDNMCRGGRMFVPTMNQCRFAVVSALASSALPMRARTRGHRIEQAEEVPLLVAAAESLTKAVALFTALSAYADVQKVSSSRRLRAGKGKLRDYRQRQCRGPLVVYSEDNGVVKAFHILPGVELVNLAPGDHLGCVVIWTESASARLDEKNDYFLSTAKIANPDITCLINSSEIQAIVRPARPKIHKRPWTQHKNPFTNKLVLFRFNPYAKTTARDGGLVRECGQSVGRQHAAGGGMNGPEGPTRWAGQVAGGGVRVSERSPPPFRMYSVNE